MSRAQDAGKDLLRAGARGVGQHTVSGRMKPDFLIVGAQRCGTTSLFRYLAGHPQVMPPLWHKGVHFFDVNYQRGLRWYAGHFPIEKIATWRARQVGRPVTGEASPYYLFHPCGAARIARDLPETRVIVMLRDPVERAFSAHRQETHRGFEVEEFERALELEPERLRGEEERLAADPGYVSFHHQHHAYVRRGEYAPQVGRFAQLLGPERVHVLESDSFFADPGPEWDRLLEFLGLEPWRPAEFGRHNARPAAPMLESTRGRLRAHFEPFDQALADVLGAAPGWSQ
jgi:hypothetical protein